MKDEISTASWEDLTVGTDWTSLGRELLANSSTANIEDTRDPNLDGSPPPGGGVSTLDDGGADLKGNNGGNGCRGVYFDHIRHLWRANWPEETIVMDRDSKRPIEVRRCTRTKGFSAKKFGFQESKRMAVAHRKSMITSGAIRKYIYQEGGPVALASAIASASGGATAAAAATATSGLSKKPLRDKKRRKQLDKPLSPNTAASAAAGQAAVAPTSSVSSSSPGAGAAINAAPIPNVAAVPSANNGLNLSPSVVVTTAGVVPSTADSDLVDVEQRPLSMELMLCLDQQAAAAAVAAAVDVGAASTSTATSSPSTNNGSPTNNSSVAYDFSFL